MTHGTEIFSLKGKTALITGATGYLGTAMATVLAEAGAHVLINSRSPSRSAELASRLGAAGLSVADATFDVTSPDAVYRFASEYGDEPLHILINNAYVGGAGNIELATEESYVASYDVTMLAAHRLFRTFLPNMRSAVSLSGDASVINFASMYAMVSPDQKLYNSPSGANPPFYGAAKAALLQWTRYAACEFGKEGIRINSISPGPFPSNDVQQSNPEFAASLAAKVPMGRIGCSDQIKGPVLFLASSASSFVNGANIVVDGGWTCW